jgi:succinate dehydrogenase/fumarate reductase flavoprotein subunit
MPQIGPDLEQFLHANSSLSSFGYVARRIARNYVERVLFGRGLELANGNALVARLLRSCALLGVEVWTGTAVTALAREQGRGISVVVSGPHSDVLVHAAEGVVLACGGFSHNAALREQLFPHVAAGSDHTSPVHRFHTGAAIELGESLGASIDAQVAHPAAWAPVTVFRGRRDQTRVFPHLRGVGLPGIIAVDSSGRRFANEADSYHDFIAALLARQKPGERIRAYLVCDSVTRHRYGLGFAKPWPLPTLPYRAAGYLVRARSLTGLARRIGVDSEALGKTVARFNAGAVVGEDAEFSRGENSFNRFKGDPEHRPNPSLAPIVRPPFFAAEIRPGDLGTFAGLEVNGAGEVLDREGQPIPGLFAAGAAATSVFGGSYPGPGANLGPAMTIGFLIGRAVAVRRRDARAERSSASGAVDKLGVFVATRLDGAATDDTVRKPST